MCACVQFVFFFKQKTAYELRISDWSSDVCSSDLRHGCRKPLLLRLGQGSGEALGEVSDQWPFRLWSQWHDHMHALAAGEHGKADKAQIGQMPFHIHCCFSYHIEVEALVRIKSQNHTIGLFHITGERTPAVKFYSAHLDASGDAVRLGEIKIKKE